MSVLHARGSFGVITARKVILTTRERVTTHPLVGHYAGLAPNSPSSTRYVESGVLDQPAPNLQSTQVSRCAGSPSFGRPAPRRGHGICQADQPQPTDVSYWSSCLLWRTPATCSHFLDEQAVWERILSLDQAVRLSCCLQRRFQGPNRLRARSPTSNNPSTSSPRRWLCIQQHV